jgi:hypothetical protein
MKIEADVSVLRSTVEAKFLETKLKLGWRDGAPNEAEVSVMYLRKAKAEDRLNCCNLEAMFFETKLEDRKRMYVPGKAEA